MRLLDRIKEDLQTYGLVEQHPKLEGRQMVMVLSPKKKEVKSTKSKESTKEKDKPETIISS